MKKFSDIKRSLVNEVAVQQPQIQQSNSTTAQQKKELANHFRDERKRLIKVTTAIKDKNIVNPASISRSLQQLELQKAKSPNKPLSAIVQSLPNKNNFLALTNKVSPEYLDPNKVNDAKFNAYVQTVRRLAQSSNKPTVKEDFEIEIQEDATEELSPPALLTLKRTGIRIFPDGRRVAMYVNTQLNLIISVPFVGKGQSAGEIVPGVLVTHATNEEIELIQNGEELQEGSLKYHLDQAEKHDDNDNTRLRDYHMTMAQHRYRGMRTPVDANKKQQQSYENNLEQGKRFKDLRSKFSEKDDELNVDDPTLHDLHSKLNPKNQKALRELTKTNPRKALEIADKLTQAATSNKPQQTEKQ